VALGLAVLAGGAVVWSMGGPESLWRDGGGAEAGPVAPEMTIQLLDGGLVSLSELRGRVVLLNFWATWCPPCRLEMPGFQRVWDARRDDGFVIVGLTMDQIPDAGVRAFLAERGFDYPAGRTTPYAATSLGYANTLPHSFLLDVEGRIRRQVTGAYDEAELVRDVDGLLREAGREPTGEIVVARAVPPSWEELEGAGHAMGSPDAPITVVEFSDYGCGYCSRFTQETFPSLREEFIETGQVRWMHVPFVLGRFPNAEEAGVASACAGAQSDAVFQGVHLSLFRQQPVWRESADPLALFRGYVEAAGGDGAEFAACYTEGRPREALARVEAVATAAQVAATPTFFVNGQRVQGALPLAQFRAGLRSMLDDAGI
jgi:protein-disulfide isomerase